MLQNTYLNTWRPFSSSPYIEDCRRKTSHMQSCDQRLPLLLLNVTDFSGSSVTWTCNFPTKVWQRRFDFSIDFSLLGNANGISNSNIWAASFWPDCFCVVIYLDLSLLKKKNTRRIVSHSLSLFANSLIFRKMMSIDQFDDFTVLMWTVMII